MISRSLACSRAEQRELDLMVGSTEECCPCGLQAPSCTDGLKNQDEQDVDCGGSCPKKCANAICSSASECASGVCDGTPKKCKVSGTSLYGWCGGMKGGCRAVCAGGYAWCATPPCGWKAVYYAAIGAWAVELSGRRSSGAVEKHGCAGCRPPHARIRSKTEKSRGWIVVERARISVESKLLACNPGPSH